MDTELCTVRPGASRATDKHTGDPVRTAIVIALVLAAYAASSDASELVPPAADEFGVLNALGWAWACYFVGALVQDLLDHEADALDGALVMAAISCALIGWLA